MNFVGDTLGVRIPICTASGGQKNPQATAGRSGDCYVVWEDARGESSGDAGDIYLRHLRSDGTYGGVQDGVPVCTAPGRQYEPKVVPYGQGGALVVWSDRRNTDTAPDIYAQGFVDEVAVDVEDLAALRTDRGVCLSWRLSGYIEGELRGVRVFRADGEDPPYAERTVALLTPAPSMTFEDVGVDPGQAYWYRLGLVRLDGTETASQPIKIAIARDVSWRTVLAVSNGFGRDDEIEIRYRIARPNAHVCLRIYDVLGRRVKVLTEGLVGVGEYVHRWDRRDDAGTRVPRGVYLVRLTVDRQRLSDKVVLVRE